MITKKKAAALLAMLLSAAATALYQCQDETPVVPSIPVLNTSDAGVAP